MSDDYYEVHEQDTVVTDGHGDTAYSVDIADNQGDGYHAQGGYDAYGNSYTEVDGVDGQGDAVHGVQEIGRAHV